MASFSSQRISFPKYFSFFKATSSPFSSQSFTSNISRKFHLVNKQNKGYRLTATILWKHKFTPFSSVFLDGNSHLSGASPIESKRHHGSRKKVKQIIHFAYPDSPGELAEPNLSAPFTWNPLSWWQGTRWYLSNEWSKRQIKRQLRSNFQENFVVKDFIAYAILLYQGMWTAIFAYDKGSLGKILTEKFLAEIESKIQKSPGLKKKWFCENLRASLIYSRYLMVPNTSWEIAQICIKFRSDQNILVYNKDNKLVSGSQVTVPITEYLVFERMIHAKDNHPSQSQWKICARQNPEEKK